MKFHDAIKEAVKYFGARGKFIKDAQKEDPEMIHYREDLLSMNKLGFLTQNSQTGNQQRGHNKETKFRYDIEERSYVSGFMKKDLLTHFFHELSTTTDKIIIIPAVCVTNPKSNLFTFAIPVTISSGKGGRKKEKEKGSNVSQSHQKKRIVSKVTTDIPKKQLEFFAKEVKLNKSELKDTFYITCIDPMWNRQSNLFNDVIKSLKVARKRNR